ncbi:unnamed protein product [Pieris macdunnoughi]|uniref:Uncharacterized protein n=1 Tax=Pieris macdunnoughi TaxID=345717 RepID=A0A821RXN5_9NEOP|nr:unnamed protein product [Pieris macdunnoughi]
MPVPSGMLVECIILLLRNLLGVLQQTVWDPLNPTNWGHSSYQESPSVVVTATHAINVLGLIVNRVI